MDTRLARTSLSYAFKPAQGWLMTTTLGLTHSRTARDAYTETGGDFNARHDHLTIERKAVDLSLSAETAINDVSRLTLTGGLEHDLSKTQTLSGSLRVGLAAYGAKPQVGLGVHFGMQF